MAWNDQKRIDTTIENWKSKLLDVSKRNRAINFRVKSNSVTILPIVNEQPAEIFRQLFLQRESMRFLPAAEDESKSRKSIGQLPWETETEEERREVETVKSFEFTPYEVSRLPGHHTDEFLQTSFAPDKLDRSLRRIEEQARASIEEQGVNTLFLALGMLRYRESRDSEIWLEAPLVMLPVELSRKSARSEFTIKAADDEPVVNPALREYLKRSFGASLPDLPEFADANDLQKFFLEIIDSIAKPNEWKVKRDVYLAFFSFQNLLLYKDLEKNTELIGNHPQIRRIILREGGGEFGLPEDVREAKLDEAFPPEATAQVVDADSSQLRAILAVARGHSVVIEGPPGTGKSQTITNLIAQALSEGKSVLFAAEKETALKVVSSRLGSVGLGEFCLNLHDTKKSKRDVMDEIKRALDRSLDTVSLSETATRNIPDVRSTLTEYVNALHEPFGVLNHSPFDGLAEYVKVRQVPKVDFGEKLEGIKRQQLEKGKQVLKEIGQAAAAIGVPALHPWRDTTRTVYLEADLDEAAAHFQKSIDLSDRLNWLAEQTELQLGLPRVRKASEITPVLAFAKVMSTSPGVSQEVLVGCNWDTSASIATEIIEEVRSLNRLRKVSEEKLVSFLRELIELVDEVRELGSYVEAEFGLPSVRSAPEVTVAMDVAAVLGQSPSAPLEILKDPVWNAPPRPALDLITLTRSIKGLREFVEQRFKADVLQKEHVEDIAFMKSREAGTWRVFNFLSSRYRAIKKRWDAYRLSSYQPSVEEQAFALEKVDELIQARRLLAASQVEAGRMFGGLWNGERTDPVILEKYVEWVTRFRQVCVSVGLKEQAMKIAAQSKPDLSVIKRLGDLKDDLSRQLLSFRKLFKMPEDSLVSASFAEIRGILEEFQSNPSLALKQAGGLAEAVLWHRTRDGLLNRQEEARRLFGHFWNGEQSDPEVLFQYLNWILEFHRTSQPFAFSEQVFRVVSSPRPNVSIVLDLSQAIAEWSKSLETIRVFLGLPDEYFLGKNFEETVSRIRELNENLSRAPQWAGFEVARANAERILGKNVLKNVLSASMKGEIPFDQLHDAFLQAFYRIWLGEVVAQRAPLRDFSSAVHDQRIAEFRELDQQVLQENRNLLIHRIRSRTREKLQTPEVKEAMPFLRRQINLQRGLSPLRTTFRKSLAAIRAIKPVWLMSPLSVAQFIEADVPPFDIVIFDEASQITTESAVSAIARGEQLVVVGDSKQLPPTNFFSVTNGSTDAPLDEDGTPLFDDTKSVLEELKASGAPSSILKWHYRSDHESLIHFSNASFYEGELLTFPSSVIDSHATGLSFEHIPDAIYEGQGLNRVEARRVADAVVRHFKTHPSLTLGVGTFNSRQEKAIWDELEIRRRQDPTLEPFFDRSRAEPFFVKALEQIQGDERDVIFLSVTYGKNGDGKLLYNFGPINRENGWRRLNVIFSRARKAMRVFSSMRGEEMNPYVGGAPELHSGGITSKKGSVLLKEYLTYAETGRLDRTKANREQKTESPFELDVFRELSSRGLNLVPQVGVAGYSIDFGVVDETFPGRYLCGIECDGATYHSSESARDRDRLRQEVLERRGWIIHRLWSTDWFKDRQGQIERLLRLVGESRQRRIVELAQLEEEKRRQAETDAAFEMEEIDAADELETGEQISQTNSFPKIALPKVPTYVFADTSVLFSGKNFNAASDSEVDDVILNVVEVESPIHFKELASRVVARWGNSVAGTTMTAKVQARVDSLWWKRKIRTAGDFIFAVNGTISVRSRVGLRMSAERIAPEEFQAAVLLALDDCDGLEQRALVSRVRSIFGFSRTGPILESRISNAIEFLLKSDQIGHSSLGLKKRN